MIISLYPPPCFRLSLIFYQHKGLNAPYHGMENWEQKCDAREKQRALNEWIEERRLEGWDPVQIQCPDFGETENLD